MRTIQEIQVVKDNEDAIFESLDDGLFYDEVSREELSSLEDIEPQTPFDRLVSLAIDRALNISMPDDSRWYNGAKGNHTV